jgi:hypothetical protein
VFFAGVGDARKQQNYRIKGRFGWNFFGFPISEGRQVPYNSACKSNSKRVMIRRNMFAPMVLASSLDAAS